MGNSSLWRYCWCSTEVLSRHRPGNCKACCLSLSEFVGRRREWLEIVQFNLFARFLTTHGDPRRARLHLLSKAGINDASALSLADINSRTLHKNSFFWLCDVSLVLHFARMSCSMDRHVYKRKWRQNAGSRSFLFVRNRAMCSVHYGTQISYQISSFGSTCFDCLKVQVPMSLSQVTYQLT